jgi:4-hydroxy-3-polyprenylbenzoate decarboxylase
MLAAGRRALHHAALRLTKDPDTGERNVGMYRMQIFDGQHDRDALAIAQSRRAPRQTLLRNGPAHAREHLVSAATRSCRFAPPRRCPTAWMNFCWPAILRKKSVPLVKCETIDLEVPADSDFVIEGYVDPTEPLARGRPLRRPHRLYTPADDYPAFHVTAITHRRDAIYPATIVGKPPMEDFYMGTGQRAAVPAGLQNELPGIVDLALPAEGVFHNLVFVSIKKQYPMQAYKIMHGLWGMGQMMFTKIHRGGR